MEGTKAQYLAAKVTKKIETFFSSDFCENKLSSNDSRSRLKEKNNILMFLGLKKAILEVPHEVHDVVSET